MPIATQTLRFVPLLAALCAVLALGGCSGKEERDTRSGADVLAELARKAMTSGNFNNAIRYYETLEARFPFSNPAKQAQLDLIYCYYRDGQREAALDAAQTFERENPTHPRVDYAIYMRGLATFSGQHSWYHRLFNADLSKRPPKDLQESFAAFGQLVQRFPNSRYADDSRQRMIFLRNRLADYEINVARYYLRRDAWLAALGRAKFVIEQYDGAPAVPEAMRIMVTAYDRLGLTDLAADARKLLAANNASDVPAPAPASESESAPWYQFWKWF